MKLIATVGIPGSGKSTWAKAQDAVEVNRDSLRKSLFCNGDSQAMFKYRYTGDKEEIITLAADAAISAALALNKDVVVSDTNLNRSTRGRLRRLAEEAGAEYEEVVFPDVNKAFQRNTRRSEPVPQHVMMSMYRAFREYEGREPYRPGPERAILCDLDGTLYDMSNRSPYSTNVSSDVVIEHIKDIVLRFAGTHSIILMSGRKEEARASTVAKLEADGIPYSALYMRADGDSRADYIIKEDLFQEYVQGRYRVDFILDDRDQVVNMWRAKGLCCLQVAEGSF